MDAFKAKAKAAASAASAASGVSKVAVKKAEEEVGKAKLGWAAKKAEYAPKVREAAKSAEPAVKEFMKHPSVQYIRKNPKVALAVVSLFVVAGVPGAAALHSCLSLIGPAEVLLPLVMTLVDLEGVADMFT